MVKKKKEKEQRKSSYMCTWYFFEIARSGQRSRAFELATTTVQLIVRGGYLQTTAISKNVVKRKAKSP